MAGVLAVLVAALAPASASGASFGTGTHTWTAPAGVTHATFVLVGAGANSRPIGIPNTPFGRGGRTEATLAVTPGQTYELVVGGANGFNGGGAGNFNGGGGTDLRIGGCASNATCGLAARVLVAGGAGGGGVGPMSVGLSGAGGGLVGDDSFTAEFFDYSGKGGTQTAGGAGAFTAGDGTLGSGGAGGGSAPGAGGGGGGYYGGGGGFCCPGSGFDAGGGGGGSGFISSSPALGITNASTTTGVGALGADGVATVTASPVITAVSPPDGATGVSIRTPIVAVFDKAMDRAVTAPAFTVVRSSDGAPVAGTVGWYGDAAPIFVPSASLAPMTRYTATVSAAARSQDGARLGAPRTWSFTTGRAATIRSVSPPAGAIDVRPDTVVYEVFDAAMDQAATQGAFTLARTGGGPPIAGHFSWYGPQVMIFTPENLLATDASYTATVSTGAREVTGAPLAANVSWSFRTVNRPVVTARYPAAGATGVSTTTPIVALFSQPMDHASTAAAFTVVRASDNAPVAGTVAWISDTAPVFLASSPLAAGTKYTARIAGTAKDQSGRALTDPVSWQFTTAAAGAAARAAQWSAPRSARVPGRAAPPHVPSSVTRDVARLAHRFGHGAG